MTQNDFYYPSKDQITSIHAREWKPDTDVRAVVQISHGMCEYIGRYARFAEFLCEKGIYVVGNDHLGHGESVAEGSRLGYFAKKDGNACVIADIHSLRRMTREKYPDVPYILMGHSMGSFLARQYLMTHGTGLSAAIIMGTGSQNPVMLAAGLLMCLFESRKGWDSTSKALDAASFGSYLKKIKNPMTTYDWLTKDGNIVSAYIADRFCNYRFTVNGYYNMMKGIRFIQKKSNIEHIPRNIPILLASGDADPVGHYGKDVKKIYEEYKRDGIKVEMKLYKGDRHEILNELDKETVMNDLYDWIAKTVF